MEENRKVNIDEALNRTGFGLYSYIVIVTVGLINISFICVTLNGAIIVPTSACELETTVTQRGFLAAGPIIGLIIGGALWGYLTDLYGRRSMLILSLLSSAGVNALASISVNWVMLLSLQFFVAILSSGLCPQALTMLSESVPAANRNFTVLIITCWVFISDSVISVFALPIIPMTFSIPLPILGIYWNSWRTLLLVYSIPCIVTASILAFLQESPNLMYSKGKVDIALENLRKIHKINHVTSSNKFEIQEIRNDMQENNKMDSKISKSLLQSILLLFKQPLLKYMLIMTSLYVFQQVTSFLVWAPTIVNQIVQILETQEGFDVNICNIINASLHKKTDPDAVPCALNVTSMVIVFAFGVENCIINIIMSLSVNRVGRRKLVILITSICGLSGIAINLVHNVIASGIFFLLFLNGVVVLGIYNAIAVTLFPTHLRSLAISICLTGGYIGMFASIQIVNQLLAINCEMGFYIYATIFGASAIVVAFLTDSRKAIEMQQINKPNEDAVPLN